MFFFPKAARLRVPAKHADSTVRFQRVRVSKSRARPLAVTIFALPLTILLLETSEYWLPDEYRKMIQKARVRTEDEKRRIRSQQEASEQQNPEHVSRVASAGKDSKPTGKVAHPHDVSLVLPLPIIRARDPVPYEKGDKEWTEATKLMDDHARLSRLRALIFDETLKVWARDKNIVYSIQKVCPKTHKARLEISLDVIVPLHRPPKFDLRTIVFLPEGPRLSERPLSNAVASRINRIWYPRVLFQAFWNASKVFTYTSYQAAKNSLQGTPSKNPSDAVFRSWASSQTAVASSPISHASSTASVDKSLHGAGQEGDQKLAHFRWLAQTMSPEQPLAQAKMAFLQTFTALQVQALQQIPEGAVVFQGKVGFAGYRGKVKADVYAIYLPEQDRLICPVVVQNTEILPRPASWHEPDPRMQAMQPGQKLTDGEPTPEKTAQFKAALERAAKTMETEHKAFDTFISAQGAMLESRRRWLAKEIENLESKMGGKASADTKRQAVKRPHYVRQHDSDPMVKMLDSQAATDPRLKKLIRQAATFEATPAELKELRAYMDDFDAIIKAQEVEGKRVGSDKVQSKRTGPLENGSVEMSVKMEKDAKEIQPEKNEDTGKATSSSIDTAREEERKKE